MLSTNKERFITSMTGVKTSNALNVSQLRTIIAHYNQKHNIKIIINGDSQAGQALIAEKINIIRRLSQLSSLEEQWLDSFVVVAYVACYWQPGSHTEKINFGMPEFITQLIRYLGVDRAENCVLTATQNTTIHTIISKFTQTIKEPSQPLPEDQIEALKKLLYGYFLDRTADNFGPFFCFMQQLNTGIADLKNIGLNKFQISAEINAIRQGLGPDDYLGYIFTNQSLKNNNHMEVLILTKHQVIKPVHWHTKESISIIEGDIDNLFVSDWLPGIPQATNQECASLGVLYLKELLKNNTKQLKENSLCFTLYSYRFNLIAPIKFNNYYFPSPQVLRYSQSNYFIKLVKAMLQDTDVVFLDHGGHINEVHTLRKRLQDSMAIALNKNDLETYKNNEALLHQLPVFIKSWLEAYQLASAKHDQMNNQQGLNRYLEYRANKISTFFDIKPQPSINQPENDDVMVCTVLPI